MRALGGEVYGVTSEPTRLARQAQDEWALGFETVGDPHHEISAACREAGFLELFVNTDTERFERDLSSPYRHPKGYFQPGVLALSEEGRVLYPVALEADSQEYGRRDESPHRGACLQSGFGSVAG